MKKMPQIRFRQSDYASGGIGYGLEQAIKENTTNRRQNRYPRWRKL
jgi:hypothetical protein